MKAIIRKDVQAVSPVIATILMVAITVVLAAVLYVMVSGLIAGPGTSKPTVAFGTPSLQAGVLYKNETIPIASASQSVGPGNYKVNLQYGATTGAAVAMPTTSGSYATVTIGSNTFRIFWIDVGSEGTVNSPDFFLVTSWSGSAYQNLPTGSYTFYLLWSDGGLIVSTTFSVS